MKLRKTVNVLIVVFLFIVIVGAVVMARNAQAQPGGMFSIPKSYGSFKGTAMDAFVFEDSSGTLRIVSSHNGQLLGTIARR